MQLGRDEVALNLPRGPLEAAKPVGVRPAPKENKQMKRKMVNADEYDCFTRWRHVLAWTQRPGARKRVKRRANRRERRQTKENLHDRDE